MTDPNAESHVAGPDEKTTVLPETAVALVEMERLQGELKGAEERARSHWEQYLRALAEIDNVRKRAARDLESTRQFAVEKFAQDLIAVKDSLELGISNSGKADVASLVEGQTATLRLLAKAFEKAQIEEINPEGQPFNPEMHEAMMTQPSGSTRCRCAASGALQPLSCGGSCRHRSRPRPIRTIVRQQSVRTRQEHNMSRKRTTRDATLCAR